MSARNGAAAGAFASAALRFVAMSDPQEDIVVTKSGELRGCRGRVLVALIVIAVLMLLLLAFLVRSMVSETQPTPQPRRRAAVEEAPAYSTVIRGAAFSFAQSSSASAHTIASPRSGDRPGPS